MALLHDLWKAAVAEGKELEEGFENLREFVDLRMEHLLAKPHLIRGVFTFLREHRPIFQVPRLTIVSRYADVVEVLEQNTVFSVTEIYLEKMQRTTGDFVLGMPDSPQYRHEIGLMRQAIHPDDPARLKTYVAEKAGEIVQAAIPAGRLDAVQGLSRLVPTLLVGDFFGTPGLNYTTTMRWMRSIFRDIFLNVVNDPNMSEEADADAKSLHLYLDALMAQRKTELAAGQPLPDDFLCRLLQIQHDSTEAIEDETIRRLVGGTIVGAVDTNSKAIAQALDVLLDRPDALKGAQEAARADDDETLAHYAFEALRFNPQNPFLIRYCTQPYTIAAGTEFAADIPVGHLVIAGTESAMFDPAKFPDPEAFQLDRPLADYLHFGHGQHTCFGRQLAAQIIPGVLKPLLGQEGLRRAPGADGELRYDGGFPENLFVEFDA